MQIYARVKKSFSRRSKLEKVPYETSESIYTLKTLIEFFVEKEVERYNKKLAMLRISNYLPICRLKKRQEQVR